MSNNIGFLYWILFIVTASTPFLIFGSNLVRLIRFKKRWPMITADALREVRTVINISNSRWFSYVAYLLAPVGIWLAIFLTMSILAYSGEEHAWLKWFFGGLGLALVYLLTHLAWSIGTLWSLRCANPAIARAMKAYRSEFVGYSVFIPPNNAIWQEFEQADQTGEVIDPTAPGNGYWRCFGRPMHWSILFGVFCVFFSTLTFIVFVAVMCGAIHGFTPSYCLDF